MYRSQKAIDLVNFIDTKIKDIADSMGGGNDYDGIKTKDDELIVSFNHFRFCENLRKNDYKTYKKLIRFWKNNKESLKQNNAMLKTTLYTQLKNII